MSTHSYFGPDRNSFVLDYGDEVEAEIDQLQALIESRPNIRSAFPSRWLALALLERDEDAWLKVRGLDGGSDVLDAADAGISRLAARYGDEAESLIADRRYTWINRLVREAVQRPTDDRWTMTDRIDRVVTHRLAGIPIFLLIMWMVFKLTADVSAPLLDWVAAVIEGPVTRWAVALLAMLGLGGTWVESLVVDGVIAGVGGVLVFVPVLMSLYFALALLEESGYMARAAFAMDRVMQTIGLQGKSFLPMIVGFGCNVPAIYATRTLESHRDRVVTGLLVPFMSCGARLPVYMLIAAVFFPAAAGLAVFSMYLLGILVALLVGVVLKHAMPQEDESAALIMELPPYRVPSARSVWSYMWERTGSFVRNAWTLILMTSIVVWSLMAVPMQADDAFAAAPIERSLFATVAGSIAPVFEPLGFGSWEASGALMTGFVAKEVVVSTLAQVYGVDDGADVAVGTMDTGDKALTQLFADLGEIVRSFGAAISDTLRSLPLLVGLDIRDATVDEEPVALIGALRTGFEETSSGHGALAALAFMVFVLLYTPCMVAVAASLHEFGARWMWTSVIGQFAVAWLMAFLVYQGGLLLGLG